jgi:large subunit ribosomal protein L6e
LSRSQVYAKRALYKRKHRIAPKKATRSPRAVVKPIGGANNGGQRLVRKVRPPRFYPTEKVQAALTHRKRPKPAKLRKSITPGTVLVLLAGRFRGKVPIKSMVCPSVVSIRAMS